LEDLEAEGQPRERVNLLNICRKGGNNYGLPGSEIRRSVQKRFAKLKAKPFEQYVRTLDKYQANPGTATARLLRESGGAAGAQDTGTAVADKDQEEEDNLTIAFTGLSMQEETESMALGPSAMFSPTPSFTSPIMD
jgi:hypothetical protein